MSPSAPTSTLRARIGRVLCLTALAALAAAAFGGCATRGVSTRALESKPIVRCYERNCSDAEDARSAAQGGCPTCVY